MKTFLLTLALLFGMTSLTNAQSLNQFQWKSRLVVLFTPDPSDPLFEKQVQLLYGENEALRERDVTILLVTPEGKFENTGRFLDESFSRQYYEKFSPMAYEFTMILVGYDGEEKFRAANRITPPSVLMQLIDEMPMRRRELMQGTGNKSLQTERKTTTRSSTTRRDH